MATELEGVRVLQAAEAVADGLWQRVLAWEYLAWDTMGKQFVASLQSR
jgi:hypothetical protein